MPCRSPVVLATVLALVVPASGCRDHADAEPDVTPSDVTPSEPAPSEAPRAREDDSPCHEAALREASEQLAARWEGWSPRSGVVPDHSLEAIEAVWTHCPGLPDEAKRMLDFLVDHDAFLSLTSLAVAAGRPSPAIDIDPLFARLPGHTRYHVVEDAAAIAAWEWRDSICENYPAIAAARSKVPGAERDAISWDRCLHRFDFVTREEYLSTTRTSGAVGFALHHWLTQHAHVDAAVADPLARAVELRGHWRVRPPAGLRLPFVAKGATVEDGALLELRPNAVYFGGHHVATIDAAGRLDPAPVPGPDPAQTEPIVVPLIIDLEIEAGHLKERAERQGTTWSTPLLLVAHRELPWSTLRPVLASAVLAGFPRVELVGLTDDRANPLRSATIHDASVRGPTLGLGAAATVQDLVDAVLARPGVPLRLLP